MGLDISAYSGLQEIDCVYDEEGQPIDPKTRKEIEGKYVQIYHSPYFGKQADGLKHKGVFSYLNSMGFHAGSYGGYGQWREELAKLAGYPKIARKKYRNTYEEHQAGAFEVESGPFHELVCFSDCEGTIGPITSAKLALDFRDFQEKVNAYPYDGPYCFKWKYIEWREAFKLAAKNGAVVFR